MILSAELANVYVSTQSHGQVTDHLVSWAATENILRWYEYMYFSKENQETTKLVYHFVSQTGTLILSWKRYLPQYFGRGFKRADSDEDCGVIENYEVHGRQEGHNFQGKEQKPPEDVWQDLFRR